MQVFLAFELFTIGIIQFGLLVGIYRYQQSQVKVFPIRYWLISLLTSALALFVYSAAIAINGNMAKPSFGITISNVLFYVSALAQTLFCISLTRDVSRKAQVLCAISVLVFACIFEYFRQLSNFEIRVLLMIFAGIVFYGLQVLEIKKLRRTNDSKQLKYLQFVTYLEFFFDSGRLPIVLLGSFGVTNIDQVPQLLLMFTLLQLITNTLSYIAIGGYWAERISFINAKAAAENEVAQEKITQISQLLGEKETLIYSLLRANKTAATGALAASIAHELNQPLGATANNIYTLRRVLESSSIDEINKAKLDALIASIAFDNQRAADIIYALRAIFIDGASQDVAIDLREITSSVLQIFEPKLKEGQIELSVQFDGRLQAMINAVEYQQILLNLLGNSIRALEDAQTVGRRISLSIKEYIVGSSARLKLCVQDNGPGVQAQERSKLFQLLETSNQSGMGLGLWLVKHMVDKRGGTISYEDAAGGGALFCIDLPLVVPHP